MRISRFHLPTWLTTVHIHNFLFLRICKKKPSYGTMWNFFSGICNIVTNGAIKEWKTWWKGFYRDYGVKLTMSRNFELPVVGALLCSMYIVLHTSVLRTTSTTLYNYCEFLNTTVCLCHCVYKTIVHEPRRYLPFKAGPGAYARHRYDTSLFRRAILASRTIASAAFSHKPRDGEVARAWASRSEMLYWRSWSAPRRACLQFVHVLFVYHALNDLTLPREGNGHYCSGASKSQFPTRVLYGV